MGCFYSSEAGCPGFLEIPQVRIFVLDERLVHHSVRLVGACRIRTRMPARERERERKRKIEEERMSMWLFTFEFASYNS